MSSPSGSNIYDVAIVGAGPVGLFAITACGMLGMKAVSIENAAFVGGQCTALYAEKKMYGIPAMVHENGDEFVSRLVDQANEFSPKLLLGHELKSVWRGEGEEHFSLRTSGADVFAKTVIFASGKGAFEHNRPPLEGIEELEGKSVFYSVSNKSAFKGKTVCIAGGGDSAAEWCLELSSIAQKVIIVHRREKFRCAQHTEEKIKNIIEQGGNIEIKTPFQLKALHKNPATGQLSSVEIISNDGTTESVEADFLLPFFGMANKGVAFEIDGMETSQDGKIIVNPTTMESSIGKVFAIGDVSSYRSKIPVILSGFHEAMQAAEQIKKYIYPEDEKGILSAVTKA